MHATTATLDAILNLAPSGIVGILLTYGGKALLAATSPAAQRERRIKEATHLMLHGQTPAERTRGTDALALLTGSKPE